MKCQFVNLFELVGQEGWTYPDRIGRPSYIDWAVKVFLDYIFQIELGLGHFLFDEPVV